MAKVWHDINLPGFSFGKTKEEPQKHPQPIEDELVKKEAEPVEYRIDRASFREGTEGFGFNKKCVVVVEGSFLLDTIRTRIQGDLYCESDAGVENLGSLAEGHADRKTGIAELEVTLFVGDEYHKLTRQVPNAKCRFFLKNIRHSHGDKIIESEQLEMPQTDVKGFGGISIRLADEEGNTITDRNALITMNGEELYRDILSKGSFKVENSPSAPFKIEIMNEENPLILELPWQRAPLLEQVIILPKHEEETHV